MPQPIKFSGSRAASILGLSGYQSQLQIWIEIQEALNPGFCKKNGYILPVFEYNTAMRWGHQFEDIIVKKVSEIKGIKITDREKFFEKEYMTCHVDGISGNILIENKTTSYFYYRDNFGEPETDKIPMNYQIQIQHNLLCTGLESCLMPVLIFPERQEGYEEKGADVEKIDKQKWIDVLYEMGNLVFYHITPHAGLQQKMIDRYREFWEVNILGGVMPEPRDYDDLKMIYTEPVGTIVATPEIESYLTEYRNIQSEIGKGGELSKRLDTIKTDVLKFMAAADHTIDTESRDKWLLLSSDGKKLAQYGKTKKGMMFR